MTGKKKSVKVEEKDGKESAFSMSGTKEIGG